MFEKLKNLMPAQRKENKEITAKIESNKERIGDLKRPMQTLLEEMYPSIENGDYSMIIGIDSSGRIPALIFDKLIKDVNKKKGYQAPETMFLPGTIYDVGYEKRNGNLVKLSENEKLHKLSMLKEKIKAFAGESKKILIVEDTVSKGSSLKDLTNLLHEIGVPFDIATISVFDTMDDFNGTLGYLKEKLGCKNLFWAQYDVPSINGQNSITGIHRNARAEPFQIVVNKSAVTRKERHATPETIYRKTVVSARQDTDVLANELIDWYESYKPEEQAV